MVAPRRPLPISVIARSARRRSRRRPGGLAARFDVHGASAVARSGPDAQAAGVGGAGRAGGGGALPRRRAADERRRRRRSGAARSSSARAWTGSGGRRFCLPDDVGKNLRETFIHELAHLARRDGLWNWLRRWATAVLWVQPLLWVLSRRLEAAAEEVCDDYVVHLGAERADYAGPSPRARRAALPPAAPASVGMVSLRSMLARRIVRILDTSRALSTGAARGPSLAMLAVGLAGTVLAGLLGVDGRSKADAQAAAKAGRPKAGAGGQDDPRSGRHARRQAHGRRNGDPGAMAADPDGIGDGYASRKKSESLRKTTGADGRFNSLSPEIDGQVIATAPGFGLGYLSRISRSVSRRRSADQRPAGRPRRTAGRRA